MLDAALPANSHDSILNDEPAAVDRLGRTELADALAAVITRCETPLVVGLYGTWGSGKTSLMRMVEAELAAGNSVVPVWFDAWQHQFDENPVVALLHTMVDELGLGEEGRKLLHVIAGALGGVLLKATTTITATQVRQLSDEYDEERFLVREKQVRLRKHFAALLHEATDHGRIRLAFFIDDLDRCVPEQVLRVLEALKLFLNMPGCVYVLGVDRGALETSIRHRYQGAEVNEADYLDKIVQLPFVIPPVPASAMKAFAETLVPATVAEMVPYVVDSLGDNPRQVKRFANSFLLNHELASRMLDEAYDPTLLAAVLLLQYRHPELFKRAVIQPELFTRLTEVIEKEHADDRWFQRVARRLERVGQETLDPYIYLSKVAAARAVEFDVVLTVAGDKKIMAIKVVREYTGLDLKRAKEIVDSAPSLVRSFPTTEEAEAMVKAFEAIGANAEVR